METGPFIDDLLYLFLKWITFYSYVKLPKSNIAIEKGLFSSWIYLLNTVIFQFAMLVYQRLSELHRLHGKFITRLSSQRP